MIAINDGTAEISLQPVGEHIPFKPRQFVLHFTQGSDGWHRNPFTIASAPGERTLRVVVDALGDFTMRLREVIDPAMPARVTKAHGGFDREQRFHRQI